MARSYIIWVMIATLSSVVAEKLIDQVIIEVSGIGYGVLMTPGCLEDLQTDDSVKLYIHEHIRENSDELFGFLSLEEKMFFELLLSVSGVGPKMAINIMSVGDIVEVRAGISNGDTKLIQTASGVGRKVAERVIVDLKDKVGFAGSADISSLLMATKNNNDEATQALMALGYTLQDATDSLAGVDSKLPLDERVKQALKGKS